MKPLFEFIAQLNDVYNEARALAVKMQVEKDTKYLDDVSKIMYKIQKLGADNI